MAWVEDGGNWRPLGKSQEPLWEAWDIGRDKEEHSSACGSQIFRLFLFATGLISHWGLNGRTFLPLGQAIFSVLLSFFFFFLLNFAPSPKHFVSRDCS